MVIQAISLLNKGCHLEVRDQRFQKGSGLKHIFSPSYHQQEVQKTVAAVERALQEAPAEARDAYISLGDALIVRYLKDRSVCRTIQAFDRQMARLRPHLSYLFPANQKLYQKWQRASQNPAIFLDHPDFVETLDSSTLLSQLKVTRDVVQIVDGEPAILVNGELVKETDLFERFEVIYSKQYDQKFLVEKATRLVYTYLDNGRGLQKHHPFLDSDTPISTLNEEDYQRVWTKASEYIRPQEAGLDPDERQELNQGRPFIMQLVTSRIEEGSSNLYRLVRNPKHPYIRMIVGVDNPDLGTHKGEVYEVGYGWKEVPFLPFIATRGRFRSPDPWEFKSCDERIVTNIPLSQEEARRFYEFTLKYHRDGVQLGIEPGFHLARQNCSVYFREACRAAGIDVPTEIDLKDAIGRVAPECIRKVGRQLTAWRLAAHDWIARAANRFIPLSITEFFGTAAEALANGIRKIRDVFIAVVLTPFHALLGGFLGRGGPAFRQRHERPEEIEPPLHNPRNFFDLSAYKLNLPGIAQEWQLQQPSTVIYPHPTRFSIVPPH